MNRSEQTQHRGNIAVDGEPCEALVDAFDFHIGGGADRLLDDFKAFFHMAEASGEDVSHRGRIVFAELKGLDDVAVLHGSLHIVDQRLRHDFASADEN